MITALTPRNMPGRLITVVGQPKTIALKYRTGKITSTGNTMYSLTSGLVAFFPPEVAAEIDSLHLDAGEPFTVCHRGGKRWDVERSAPAASVQKIGTATGQREAAPSHTVESTNHTPAPQSPQMPVNGAGKSELECALTNAIRACANAETYAKSIDYDCRFSPEQVKCMAISVLIGMQQARR